MMDRNRYSAWFLLSLFLHLLLLWFLFFAVRHPTTAKKELEVELFADRDPKQIVDIPNLAPKEKPKHTKFLSQFDQRVDQETKAPRQRPQPWQDAVQQKPLAKTDGLTQEKENPLVQNRRPETDFLPEIPLGEKTYINAEAFKHTGYYLEIKRKIELTWNPNRVMRKMFQRGISVERGVLATYLGITLHADGRLDDIVVLESAGVPALDEEAQRAFRASAPFTHPPEELLSRDGKLRFEFGFILYGR